MSIWSAIARTLTAFAVLGLIVGALSAPAQARAVAGGTVDRDAAAQQEGVATPHVASMSEDMPCCDPEPSGPDCRDTKACPFAAACARLSGRVMLWLSRSPPARSRDFRNLKYDW